MHATRLMVTLLAILSVVTVVDAQDRGGRRGGWGGRASRALSTPEYARRDLPIFVDELTLDRTQKVIVETLLMDYHATFEAAYEEVQAQFDALRPQRTAEEDEERRSRWEQVGQLRSEMREIRDTIDEIARRENLDPTIITRLEKRLETLDVQMDEQRATLFNRDESDARAEAQSAINDEWARQRKAMGKEFMVSVQATLNDDQLDRWSIFERNLRRVKTMRLGRLSGEDVDLFILMKQLAIAVETVPELAESLEAYAYTLDSALVARNSHIEENRETASRAIRAGDLDVAEAVTSKETSLRKRVRDVNEEHSGFLATVLGIEVEGAAFQHEYRMRAFPRIYRPTRMQRAFEAARELEGLTPDVAQAVVDLEQAYLVELGIANDKIHRTVRKEEPKEQVERIKRMAEWRNGGGRERGRGRDRGEERELDPTRQAYLDRDEMDYRYWQQLQAILTPEQIALLPEVREPSERRRRGGGRDWRERLAEVDANGDGKLQKSEAPEWMLNFFDRLDGNSDGTLDENEIENMRNRMRGGGGRGRGGDGGRGGRGGDGGGRGGRGGGGRGNDA